MKPSVPCILAVAAIVLFPLHSATAQTVCTIDFETLTGPSYSPFTAGEIQSGLATISGGAVATNPSFSYWNQSTVYLTMMTDPTYWPYIDVGVDPTFLRECTNCAQTVTITFSEPVSNFSFEICNGQVSSGLAMDVVINQVWNYTDLQAFGSSLGEEACLTYPFPPEYHGGEEGPTSGIQEVTITQVYSPYPTGFWDFFIDNITYTPPSNESCEPATPTVAIGPLVAVGKGFIADVPVTITPDGTPITLTLSTTSGTGAAKFTSNNSTTLSVSTTGNVNITGVTESSTAENIRLSAIWDNETLATRDFTVLSVTLSLRASGKVSQDNAARQEWRSRFGTFSLGAFHSSSDEWVTGVEIIGAVTPSDFNQAIELKRLVTSRGYFDQTLATSKDGEDDSSFQQFRDDDPQSGGSTGTVYDLDGPLVFPLPWDPIGTILRYRGNFTEWATVDGVRVSSDLHWFSRISARKERRGNVLDTSISGDNVAGSGTTQLTWNLQ